MLQKFRAARAAANKPAAPAPTSALPPAAGPATVESLGQQLREVLPARRLQSVSLCDHEANCLWLSEGALGPDEHMLVLEALEALAADASLPCHETALEDGRLAVFLPVRAPMGNLVGVAMILADSKSVGDDTLERMTAAPVRTIMQRLAVLLKPSGALGALPPIEVLEDSEPEEVAAAPEIAETAEEAPEPPEAPAAAVELALVAEVELEVEVGLPAARPAPAAQSEADDDLAETIISAEEIANILELELVPDELPPAAAAEPAPAPPQAKGAAKPAAPTPAAEESGVADSGMLKLEFLAEPPVVRPAQNPSAVAKKLHAASKAAEVAPTRGPRPLPTPVAKAPVARAPVPAPAAKGKAPAPAAASVVKAAATPATGNGAAPAAAPGLARNPFEPVPPHSKLSLNHSDDVVVLFDSDPVQVPGRPGAPAKAAPAPAAQARVAAPPAKPAAQPVRVAPARIVPPARTSPAVRTPTPARPAPAAPRSVPAARAPAPPPVPAPAPAAAVAPAPAAAPVAAAVPVVAPAPAAPVPVLAPAPAAPAPAASTATPPLDLLPFAKLRAGGQTRRFQVLPRASAAARDSAALDEQTLQQLLAWLAANRSQWNSVPTSFTVNLSVTSLEDERFLAKIGAALNSHGIGGETLGFEIAESLCAQERAKAERFFSQCEKLGAWIAIDDFSFDSQVLPLLRSKALRMLKLDARLTAAALRDKLSQAVVVATVQAAKVLGIHCSAKKADSHASLQYLTAIGLDYAQGAALAKTVALEAIATVPESRATGVFQALENNE